MPIEVTREEQEAILTQMAALKAAQDDQDVKRSTLAGTQATLDAATVERDAAAAEAQEAADAVAEQTQRLVAVALAAFQDDTPPA